MKHLITHFQKQVRLHLFDYLLLATAGIFFLLSLNLFRGEKTIQYMILIAFVSFYITWGIYHHIVEDTLHLKIVVEYILVGATILFLLKVVFLP